MIVVDDALRERDASGQPIRVGMVGAGFMARGIANQIVNYVPGMTLAAISNRTPARAREAFTAAGAAEPVRVGDPEALDDAVASGRTAITDDAAAICSAETVDVVLEVTGAVEFGAGVALQAIGNGKHFVTMNAELDGTLGPVLKRRADDAGVIYTVSDGDQPGVQMNLHRFVRGIGVTPLLCGNVKGLHDPYRNPTTQAEFARRWGQNPYMVTSFADGTKISFEQAIVANATGMTILRRGMTGREHRGHVDDLTGSFDADELAALGGVVDYVVGATPSPGVFVLGTHDDPAQRHYLNLYKLGEGPLYSFYTPYHLCHFEVPSSIARAALLGDTVLAPAGPMRVEVVTTAKVDLAPGATLDAMGGYLTYGLCETAATTRTERLLPIGVAEGCRVTRAVTRDSVLTYDDVELPPGRLHDVLRAEQTALTAEAAVPAPA
jgi:predicted homoserine dehydrogenase-like protein